MQTGKKILKIVGWITGMGALVLIGTVAVTQNAKKAPQKNTPVAIVDSVQQNDDSVEIVGIPTGEDPWKEVKKLVTAYYQETGMEYKGMIKVIDDNADTSKVVEEQPFQYTILNNDNYYYRLAHIEMVNKKNYLLAVDNENKTVSISAKAVKRHKNAGPFDLRDFKKLMEKSKAHAIVTRNGNEKILTIDNIGDADIQGYRIYYSPDNYRIHKMLIGMVRLSPIDDENDDQSAATGTTKHDDDAGGVTPYYYYLEVSFNEVQSLSLKEKDFNPEKKFIQVENGRVSLTPGFKDYEFLNGGSGE